MSAFETQVQKDCGLDLYASKIDILQVNVGFRCNQSCQHCHLACGPDRREMMTWETMRDVIMVAKDIQPHFVDITGGAPEIHPHLKRFMEALRNDGHTVQVRTNLTVLTEPGLEDMPQFFKVNCWTSVLLQLYRQVIWKRTGDCSASSCSSRTWARSLPQRNGKR